MTQKTTQEAIARLMAALAQIEGSGKLLSVPYIKSVAAQHRVHPKSLEFALRASRELKEQMSQAS